MKYVKSDDTDSCNDKLLTLCVPRFFPAFTPPFAESLANPITHLGNEGSELPP